MGQDEAVGQEVGYTTLVSGLQFDTVPLDAVTVGHVVGYMVPGALTVTLEVMTMEMVDAAQEPVDGFPEGPVGFERGGEVTVEVTV